MNKVVFYFSRGTVVEIIVNSGDEALSILRSLESCTGNTLVGMVTAAPVLINMSRVTHVAITKS